MAAAKARGISIGAMVEISEVSKKAALGAKS
jgi:hypothetical protein